jgi:hypothetical protein
LRDSGQGLLTRPQELGGGGKKRKKLASGIKQTQMVPTVTLSPEARESEWSWLTTSTRNCKEPSFLGITLGKTCPVHKGKREG